MLPAPEPAARSSRLRIPLGVAAAFGAAALVSAELFSRVGDGGSSWLLALTAILPLQAVAVVWIWSQRGRLSRGRSGTEEL